MIIACAKGNTALLTFYFCLFLQLLNMAMNVHFYLRYHTNFGESLHISLN